MELLDKQNQGKRSLLNIKDNFEELYNYHNKISIGYTKDESSIP